MADNERELFRKKILKLPELNKNGEVVQSSKTGTHVVPSKRLEIETPRPKQDLSNGINQRNALLGTTGFSGKQEEPSTLTKKFKDIYNNLMNKYSKSNNPASQQSFVNNVNQQSNQAQPSLTNKLLENKNIDAENKPVKEVKPNESTKNKAEFILENRQKNLEYEELKKEKESGEANYGFADDFNGEKGNIDINHREILRNSDGSISTEKNIYIEETDENGKPSYVVIPTVVDGIDIDPNGDGNKAYQHYRETGEFLGRFSSEADAEAYSRELSLRQSKFYRKEMSDWRSELYQRQQEEKADLGKFIPLDKGALTNADGGINKENLRKWAEANAATLSDIGKQTLKGAILDPADAVNDIMLIASAKILESQGFYEEAEVQYRRARKDTSEDWVNAIGAAIKTGAEFGNSSFAENKNYFKNLESKSFLSESGEGMVQSAASTTRKALTQPILPWQASMAVEVAPRSYLEGKEKGYSEAKSVINAVADVGIEILSENVGGGFGLKGTGSGSGKYSEIVKQGRRTLKAYLDTASDEGKEEVLGGIMSTVKDYLLENNYDEYSAQQLSQELIQYIAGGDALSDYIGGAGSVLMGDLISHGRSTLRGVRDTQARNQRVIADDTITPETKKTRLEHLDTISESDLLPIQKEALSNRVYDGALDQKGDDKVLKELIKQEEKKTQKIEKAANAIDNEVKKSDLSQEQKNRILSNVDLLKDRDTSIDDQLTKVRSSIEKQQKQNRDINSRDRKVLSSILRGETTLDKLIDESDLTGKQKELLNNMSTTEGFSTKDIVEQFNKYKRENKVVGKAEQAIKDQNRLLKNEATKKDREKRQKARQYRQREKERIKNIEAEIALQKQKDAEVLIKPSGEVSQEIQNKTNSILGKINSKANRQLQKERIDEIERQYSRKPFERDKKRNAKYSKELSEVEKQLKAAREKSSGRTYQLTPEETINDLKYRQDLQAKVLDLRKKLGLDLKAPIGTNIKDFYVEKQSNAKKQISEEKLAIRKAAQVEKDSNVPISSEDVIEKQKNKKQEDENKKTSEEKTKLYNQLLEAKERGDISESGKKRLSIIQHEMLRNEKGANNVKENSTQKTEETHKRQAPEERKIKTKLTKKQQESISNTVSKMQKSMRLDDDQTERLKKYAIVNNIGAKKLKEFTVEEVYRAIKDLKTQRLLEPEVTIKYMRPANITSSEDYKKVKQQQEENIARGKPKENKDLEYSTELSSNQRVEKSPILREEKEREKRYKKKDEKEQNNSEYNGFEEDYEVEPEDREYSPEQQKAYLKKAFESLKNSEDKRNNLKRFNYELRKYFDINRVFDNKEERAKHKDLFVRDMTNEEIDRWFEEIINIDLDKKDVSFDLVPRDYKSKNQKRPELYRDINIQDVYNFYTKEYLPKINNEKQLLRTKAQIEKVAKARERDKWIQNQRERFDELKEAETHDSLTEEEKDELNKIEYSLLKRTQKQTKGIKEKINNAENQKNSLLEAKATAELNKELQKVKEEKEKHIKELKTRKNELMEMLDIPDKYTPDELNNMEKELADIMTELQKDENVDKEEKQSVTIKNKPLLTNKQQTTQSEVQTSKNTNSNEIYSDADYLSKNEYNNEQLSNDEINNTLNQMSKEKNNKKKYGKNWIETLDNEIKEKYRISDDVWDTFDESKKWEYRNRQRKNITNTVNGEIRNSIVENIESQVVEQANNMEENEPDVLDILDGKAETKPEETQTTTPEVQLEATPKELWEKYKAEEKENNGENRELYFVDSEGNRISTEDDAFDTYLALATPQDFVRDLKAAVDEANKNNFLETYKVTESVYKKALNTKNEEQLAKNEQIISALASNSITDKFKTLDSLEVYDVVTKDEFYKNFNAKIRTVNGKKVKDKAGKAAYSRYLDEKLRRTLYARTGEKYDINDEFTGYEIGNIKKLEITNAINRTSSAHFQKIVEKFTNPETATNGTGIDLFSMKQRHGGLVSRAMMYTASPQRVAELMFDYDTAKAINDEFINPTFKALARKERYIQNIVDRVDKFGIKDGTKDSKLLFQLIEGQKYDDDGNPIGQYTPTMLKEELKGDTERINRITNAARDIKTIYDSIFNAVNDVLYENGFPKIPKRAHYITHMTKKSQDSLNTYIGKVFGNQAQEDRANMLLGIFPDEEVNGEDEEEVKTTDNSSQSNAINREGIKVQRSSSGFEKARTQKVTETDAIRAVKLYTKSMADIIFLTEHTQKLRAFEKLLRQASNLEVMNEHTKVLDIDSLDTAQQLMFEKLREDKAFKEYADWIDGYVNQLVNIDKYSSEGQKELIDMYNKYVVGSVGKNAVAFNPNTAATNFIPMSTTIALTNPIYSLKAIGDMVSEDIIHKNRKQLFQDSDVWTRRHGANLGVDTENVGKFSKATRKITDVGMALMGFVDDFSTEFTIRAKYNEFVAKNKGKKEFKTEAGNLNEKKLHQAAMEYADDFTSRLLAERSQGTLPEVFNNKALKMFTQFQIEPTNIVLGYMHDAKMREKRAIEEGANPTLAKAKTAADLLSMAVSSQVFNNIFESIFGSRPNIDLIEVIKIALGYDDDEEEDNVFKKLFGLNVKKNDNPVSENLGNAFGELLSYMPIINQFGENARVPTVGMLEDMFGGYGELGTALTNLAEAKYNGDEEEVSKSKLQLGSVAEGAIKNTAKYALPTGGGIQAARMYDTARTYQKGGNYNAKGQLRYPVQDQDKTPARFAQALLFGRKNMPTAKEYANNGYKALSEKQTNEYNSLENTSYKQYLRFVNADKTNKLGTLLALDTTTSDKWKIFNNSILTEDQSKAAASAISNGLATKKDYMNWYSAAKQQGVNMPSKEKLEKMVENGTSIKSYIKYQKEYNKMSKTSLLTSNDSNMNEKDKARILKDGDYSTEEKDKLYESIAGDSKNVETYNMFKRMGNGEQDIDVFLDYVLADKTNTPKPAKYDNSTSHYSDKDDKIKNFVNTHELNDTQRAFIKAKHAVPLSRTEKQLIQNFANTLSTDEYNEFYGSILSPTLVGTKDNGEGEKVTAVWKK